MTTTVTVHQHQAVSLLDAIESGWELKGSSFFNDYAVLVLCINGEKSPHRMVLHRNGTWDFKAEVSL